MADIFEIGRMIGEAKAGPAGVLNCGWGYRGVTSSRDGGIQVPGKVPMSRDGQRRGLVECRALANSEQWKASWELVDGTECCVWFRKLRTGRRLVGSCRRSRHPSEAFDADPEGRASSAVEVEHQVEEWDKLYTLFQKCYENASLRSQGIVKRDDNRGSVGEGSTTFSINGNNFDGPSGESAGRSRAKLPGLLDVNVRDGGVVNQGGIRPERPNSRRQSVQASSTEYSGDLLRKDKEELFEEEKWGPQDDNGIDTTVEAGRSFSRVDSLAKGNGRQTSGLGSNPAGDRDSSPPNGRTSEDVEREFDRTAFLRSREVEIIRDKGGETELQIDEDTPSYNEDARYVETEREWQSAPRVKLMGTGEKYSEAEQESSSTAVGQRTKEIDDWQDPSDYDQASRRRIRSSRNRFTSKDEVIRRRLQDMEQEETETGGDVGLSFRSKDKDAASVNGWRAIKKVDGALARFPDGPIMTRSSLVAKQVISQDFARSLGFVVQIWVEVDQWKVVAIEIRPSMLFGLVDAILLDNLAQVGDVILVPDEDALEGELDWTGCEPVIGFDIFTENALYLGKVRDFEFNLDNGGVISLEFDSFGVPLIPSSVVSTFSLPISEIVEVGEDCLLVRAGAEKRMQVLTKGLWGKLSGDISPSKGVKPDDRLVMKSVSRRNPRSGEGKQRLSRADISRAQEVADMYVSSRKSDSSGNRGVRLEPPNEYIRKQKPRPASRGQRESRRGDIIVPEDEELDL